MQAAVDGLDDVLVQRLEARHGVLVQVELSRLNPHALRKVRRQERDRHERHRVHDQEVRHAPRSRRFGGRVEPAEADPGGAVQDERRVEREAHTRQNQPASPHEEQRSDGDRKEVEERHRAVDAAGDPHERGDDEGVADELQVDERPPCPSATGPAPRRASTMPYVTAASTNSGCSDLARLQGQLDGEGRDQEGGHGDHPQDHQPAELPVEFDADHRDAGERPVRTSPPSTTPIN